MHDESVDPGSEPKIDNRAHIWQSSTCAAGHSSPWRTYADQPLTVPQAMEAILAECAHWGKASVVAADGHVCDWKIDWEPPIQVYADPQWPGAPRWVAYGYCRMPGSAREVVYQMRAILDSGAPAHMAASDPSRIAAAQRTPPAAITAAGEPPLATIGPASRSAKPAVTGETGERSAGQPLGEGE